jgi:hypothetical protein
MNCVDRANINGCERRLDQTAFNYYFYDTGNIFERTQLSDKVNEKPTTAFIIQCIDTQ